MTEQEWLEKAESEGLWYAVVEYGMTEDDLDPGFLNGGLYHAIKGYRHFVTMAVPYARTIEDMMEDQYQ